MASFEFTASSEQIDAILHKKMRHFAIVCARLMGSIPTTFDVLHLRERDPSGTWGQGVLVRVTYVERHEDVLVMTIEKHASTGRYPAVSG